ncbi:telomeric repeat-binding factor 2-like isoform X2 [Mya arenaria]|uniref:telomeric repeat-binding factor 2-like isoform X2 n=1 Tax=Mya arenaria TaxID=6604 RepID=UPI0022E3F34B|nr:telomeric repeat-binding factor 2-like isoform X2 [Mya arenaria]
MAAQLKVNEWILEYYANEIFKEFNENHKLSSQTMSLVEVLIMNQSYNKKDTVNELIIFLMVLCRLSDGSDPTIVYEEHENSDDGSEISLSSCTPLEDLISHWKALVNMQVDEDIVAEGNELTHIIQLESVLVCLRIDEQDRAKAVFDRQFGTVDESNKELMKTVRRLKNMVSSTQPVKKNVYTDFLGKILKFLNKIPSTLRRPSLIIAAEEALNSLDKCPHKGGSGDADQGSNSFTRTRSKENSTDSTTSDTEKGKAGKKHDTSNEKEKRKLWNENKERFGENQEEPSSSGLGNEPQNKSSSDECKSPNKKLRRDGKTYKSLISPEKSPGKPSRSSTPQKKKSDLHAEKAGPSGRSRQENRVDRHLSEHLNSSSDSSDVCVNDELEDEFNRISTLSTTSRGRKKWTDEEMEEFYDATVMLGVGKWAQIKEYMGTERTGVMLKDKWRNMVKNGDIERFAKVKKRK